MSGNRIGFVVLTCITERDGRQGAAVDYQEVRGPYSAAEKERDRLRAHYDIDVKFGEETPPDRYSYEVAELVTCDRMTAEEDREH